MLSDIDRQILTIENQRWRYPGRKLVAITRLGVNETQYGQRLVQLAADPAAAAEFPLLVARLQRRLEAGRRARSPRRGSIPA